MIAIPHATEAIRMQAFQTHTAAQPISIQPLQTQQKPRVTEVGHNAEKYSLLSPIQLTLKQKLRWRECPFQLYFVYIFRGTNLCNENIFR